jgi:hypothetical protein
MDELDNVVTNSRAVRSSLIPEKGDGTSISNFPIYTVASPSQGSITEGYTIHPPIQRTTSFRSNSSGILSNGEIDPRSLIVDNLRKNKFPFDTGHEFMTRKETFNLDVPTWHGFGRDDVSYKGPLWDYNSLTFMSKTTDQRHTFDGINLAIGTEFLAKTRPTKAAANVAQALIETIRDVPKIPFNAIDQARQATQLLRTGSDEYLNIVFGWQPLVSDVLKTCRAIVYSDKILQQYRRDSGRQVRRRAEIPVIETGLQASTDTTYMAFPPNGYFGGNLWYGSTGYGHTSVIEESSEKYWFSGAFSYLLSGDDSVYEKSAQYAQLANKLLGIRLDATVLWELVPWSWLADWFTDIGSFVSLNNDMNQDNLVVRYGYLMRTSVYTRVSTQTGLRTFYDPVPTASTYYKLVQKERVRATPYGFGFDLTTLSAGQIAILASLGLTKSPGKFWWG